jgi:hypothetical protein
MIGLNGGLLGKPRTAGARNAIGLWTPNEQSIYQRQGSWVNDARFADVPLLLHMDGTNGSTTFTDSSSTPKTVTANGNAQISTAQSKFGGASGLFDGTGDNLQISSPATSLINWYTSSYTIEYWIRATSFTQAPTTGAPIVVGNMTPTSTTNYWSFGPISNGTVRFYYFNGSTVSFTTVGAISTATWTHLAFVNQSGALTIYIDGVAAATSTISGTPQSSASTAFAVGQFNNTGFNGYLDDLRITTSARYTANFTPPAAPFPDA